MINLVNGTAIKKAVVIVGGGPAGMAVADRLFQLGIREILLLEKDEKLGGVLSQCIHDGFGLTKLGVNITGPEYAEVYIEKINEQNIPVCTSSTVLHIDDEQSGSGLKRVTVATPEGILKITASVVVVATGCRERGRGNLFISGSRPAGIFTAGTAQAFLNLKNLMPGKRILIVGSGDIGLIMARRLTLEGAEVVCVVEKEGTYGGIKRNIKQCLEDFGIPLLTNTVVQTIYGKNRVQSADIVTVDSFGKKIGVPRNILCDTIILSAGLIPDDTILNAREGGIFICGNALFVHGLVDDVSLSGEEVAEHVALCLKEGINKVKDSKYFVVNAESTREWQKELVKTQKLNENKLINTITCIKCPKGCEIDEITFEGARCENGTEYAKSELVEPVRVLTSSVKVCKGELELVSVKTSAPIPRSEMILGMQKIKKLRVQAPIKCGEIIEKDFLHQGVSLVATRTVKKCNYCR